MNHQCAVREEDLGPYLLGQLDPEADAAIAQLVAGCPSCAEEVARLRPVVLAMAAGSPPPEMATADPSPSVALRAPMAGLQDVLTTIGHERRGRRPGRRVLAGAVAAALVAVAGAAALLLPGGSDRDVVLASASADASQQAAGHVRLDDQSWGTAIVLEASGLQPGQTYGVWLERREGGRLPAGSFVPDSGGTVRLDLSSGLALDDSGAVGIALLPGGRTADAVDVLSARLDG